MSASKPPVIGLTTYLNQAQMGVWDVRASFLPAIYFHAVTAVGGIAVLLPPQPVTPAIAEGVLDGLDGLLITGGNRVPTDKSSPTCASEMARHESRGLTGHPGLLIR